MITSKQYIDLCQIMVKAINKGHELIHLDSDAPVTAIDIAQGELPKIHLGDIVITFDTLHKYGDDFDSVMAALSIFGYKKTRTLLEDEQIENVIWPDWKRHIDSATTLLKEPLDFAREYLGDFTVPTDNCMHKSCPECGGTGTKINGGSCIHGISCSCSRCTPH
jgi:hypothetical protein